MRWISLLALMGLAGIEPGVAQVAPSPYTGQQNRDIKALSREEILAYREGNGMGLAKVAELNHYAGPRHILDLAAELDLSAEQHLRVQDVFERMRERARQLGHRIIEQERRLDRAFAEQRAQDDSVRQLVVTISTLQGELRWTHLEAHLRMKEILDPGQAVRYDELRGYADGHPGHHR